MTAPPRIMAAHLAAAPAVPAPPGPGSRRRRAGVTGQAASRAGRRQRHTGPHAQGRQHGARTCTRAGAARARPAPAQQRAPVACAAPPRAVRAPRVAMGAGHRAAACTAVHGSGAGRGAPGGYTPPSRARGLRSRRMQGRRQCPRAREAEDAAAPAHARPPRACRSDAHAQPARTAARAAPERRVRPHSLGRVGGTLAARRQCACERGSRCSRLALERPRPPPAARPSRPVQRPPAGSRRPGAQTRRSFTRPRTPAAQSGTGPAQASAAGLSPGAALARSPGWRAGQQEALAHCRGRPPARRRQGAARPSPARSRVVPAGSNMRCQRLSGGQRPPARRSALAAPAPAGALPCTRCAAGRPRRSGLGPPHGPL
jgi:hypothetical protein